MPFILAWALIIYLATAVVSGGIGLAVKGDDPVEQFHERITFNLYDLSPNDEDEDQAASTTGAATEPAGSQQQAAPTAESAAPTQGQAHGGVPQTAQAAQDIFGVEPMYLNPVPSSGNPTGWVIGTSGSEAEWIYLSATIPSGMCVDYDPGASELTGDYETVAEYSDNWHRVKTTSETQFNGLKATVYWTPCVK